MAPPRDPESVPLRFPDPDLERAYWHERVLANRRLFRTLAVVGGAIYLIAWAANELGVSWPVLRGPDLLVVRIWAAIAVSLCVVLYVSTTLVSSPKALSRIYVVVSASLLANHLVALFLTSRPNQIGFFIGLLVQIGGVVGLTRFRVVTVWALATATLVVFVAGSIMIGDFTSGVGGATVYVVAALAIGVFFSLEQESTTRLAFLQRRKLAGLAAELRDAHAQSENLLQNMLPGPIAARLKADPGAIADSVDEATVLFADISGFTAMSAQSPPAELVAFLNRVFSGFDQIAQRHGLEKIKTIGDAYMAAAGVPEPRSDHAIAVVSAAIEMRDLVATMTTPGGAPLSMRIGIHTGPLVAGVIGTNRYAYDLWGDTVNTASRMESHGVSGAIHITERTHELLDGAWPFVDRGLIEIKGKGRMRTWLLPPVHPRSA